VREFPTIQGVGVVWNAKTGGPLADMDSVTLNSIRSRRDDARRAVRCARGIGALSDYRLRSPGQVSARSDAFGGKDICITCTTSKSPVLTEDLDLCFVAGASADNPEKHKIAPGLTYRAGVESRFDLSGLSA
jgi:ornithine cyclodeaminase/alanine dehydrogenase-like protein (mu-crystallin family)